MQVEVRLGADPECVIEFNGKPVSAIPLIKGTKRNPARMPDGTVFSHDNVLAEFAITPSDSAKEFADKIRDAKTMLHDMIPSGHAVRAIASAIFDESELNHPEAKRFGCDPDFDAWTVRMNRKPDPGESGLRSCGGHVHVGQAKGSEFLADPYGKIDMIKALDSTLGMVLTSIADHEVELPRRRLYGKAGCHRPTSYGCEYRTPSCSWISDYTMSLLVGHIVRDAAYLVASGRPTAGLDDNTVIEIINTCDSMRATGVVQHLISQNVFSHETFMLIGEAC